MPRAYWAFGVTLGKAGGDAIASLTNINGLDVDSDEIDITSHDSPGGYEEVIQSIRRTGTVTVEGNFNPADDGQAALMADYLSGAVDNYEIDFTPTGLAAKWSFSAFVKKAPSTEAPVDGQIPFSAELRVTGEPSLDLEYSANITTVAISNPAITLAPAWNASRYEYTAVAATSGVAEIKFTVTAAGGHALTINGTTVAHGVETDDFPLGPAGSVTRFVVAKKETGKIARKYIIHVTRPA